MNGLQVFNYQSQQLRTAEQDGQIWWVLTDVCRILDLSNPRAVAERLDEDERCKLDLPRQGKTWAINESGLYAVILRSDKPEAKPFRKWVTAEVLPAIRRTGAYSATEDFPPKGMSQIPPPVSPQDKVLELMEELMQARQEIADIRVAAAQKEAEDLRLELEFALGHDEASERKRAQSRERVRKYRERQRQEKAAQQ